MGSLSYLSGKLTCDTASLNSKIFDRSCCLRRQFLDAFAKLRNTTLSFVVCLSACPHATSRLRLDGFSLNLIFLYFFENLSGKLKFHLNLTIITDTLHEDQYTFLIIFGLFLLIMRNVSDKLCRETRNTFCVQ